MLKKPLFNALLASAYIIFIALMMQLADRLHPKDTIITPIAVLSVFTLSAAIMGYLFLSNPLQMYLDGKKKEAVTFFMKTVGIFAIITLLFVGALVAGLGA